MLTKDDIVFETNELPMKMLELSAKFNWMASLTVDKYHNNGFPSDEQKHILRRQLMCHAYSDLRQDVLDASLMARNINALYYSPSTTELCDRLRAVLAKIEGAYIC